jgi:hypothetical protein
MIDTFYLAIAALYTLYFMWLISSDEQENRHLQEIADADPESRADLTVNDYFFEDNYKD